MHTMHPHRKEPGQATQSARVGSHSARVSPTQMECKVVFGWKEFSMSANFICREIMMRSRVKIAKIEKRTGGVACIWRNWKLDLAETKGAIERGSL